MVATDVPNYLVKALSEGQIESLTRGLLNIWKFIVDFKIAMFYKVHEHQLSFNLILTLDLGYTLLFYWFIYKLTTLALHIVFLALIILFYLLMYFLTLHLNYWLIMFKDDDFIINDSIVLIIN